MLQQPRLASLAKPTEASRSSTSLITPALTALSDPPVRQVDAHLVDFLTAEVRPHSPRSIHAHTCVPRSSASSSTLKPPLAPAASPRRRRLRHHSPRPLSPPTPLDPPVALFLRPRSPQNRLQQRRKRRTRVFGGGSTTWGSRSDGHSRSCQSSLVAVLAPADVRRLVDSSVTGNASPPPPLL